MVRILSLASLFLSAWIAPQFAYSQLKVLSPGSPDSQWKSVQLQLIDEQLQLAAVSGPLRSELEAQKRWLSQWQSGSLSDKSLIKQSEQVKKLLVEPAIDPQRKATALRHRLLGKGARPTEKDTGDLQEALEQYPDDLGIQQLFLHWIDQRHYRDEYADTIVEKATSLAGSLAQGKQSEAVKLARAFCYYRAARALMHLESLEAAAKKAIADPQKYEAQLLGLYNQLGELVGHNRPEFILLEIRMLRRDSWFGRALVLLEESANLVEREWYLTQRYELLQQLGWRQPAKEAEAVALADSSSKDAGLRSAARPKSK